MKKSVSHVTRTLLVVGLCVWLSGCAIVQSKSNKDHAYTQKIDRIVIWSGIPNISYFSGPLKPTAPFPETFQRSLMAEFEKHGIVASYMEQQSLPDLSPDELQNVVRLETGNPSTRMTISVKQTSLTGYAGFTHLDLAVFDLSLYSIATNQRVWRANITIDASADVPKWSEATARKFVNAIFALLAKDGLI